MKELLIQLKAIAEPTRLRILAICAAGELTVSELTRVLGQSQPRVSRHLKLLCDAGLLTRFREGTWVFYRLADASSETAARLSDAIVSLLPANNPELDRDRQRLAEVRQVRKAAAESYFNENAEQWDEIRALHVDEAEVEKTLLSVVPSATHHSVIDIGTGTGRILELFGASVDRGLGIDFSREMLSLARLKLSNANLSKCLVRQGDMYALPAADGDFDIAFLHLVLHYADDPLAAIIEASRVIAPMGLLAVVDFAPHDVEALREQHAHRRLGFRDEEITDMFLSSCLQCVGIHSLPGDPLTVKIWLGEKQNGAGLVVAKDQAEIDIVKEPRT